MDAREIIKEFGYKAYSQLLSDYLATLISYLLLRNDKKIVFYSKEGDEILTLKRIGLARFEVELPSPIPDLDYLVELFKNKEAVSGVKKNES